MLTKISESQRDSFGQYTILAGHTHVFEVQLPMLQGLTIQLTHTKPGSQDFSIVAWMSEVPLDQTILHGIGHHRLTRGTMSLDVLCEFLRRDQHDDRAFAPSGRTIYLNVKNLQNSTNSYEMNIDTLVP